MMDDRRRAPVVSAIDCIFAALQKHSFSSAIFLNPIKSIVQDFTCLPAAPGKAALAFALHLI